MLEEGDIIIDGGNSQYNDSIVGNVFFSLLSLIPMRGFSAEQSIWSRRNFSLSEAACQGEKMARAMALLLCQEEPKKLGTLNIII